MVNQVQNFLNYLLDSETTSERSFFETIQKHSELFQSRYLKDWEHTVLYQLQQVLRNIVITSLNNEDSNGQKSKSESSEDESTASSSSSEDEEAEEEKIPEHLQAAAPLRNQTAATNKYIDPVRQCQRLLRLLHYSRQKQSEFSELYFCTLEQCLKSDNEKIIIVVLQQIASHLFEGTSSDNEYQRLIQNIPTSIPRFSILPSYQPALQTIETFLNTDKADLNTIHFLSKHLDILYPYTTRYLEVHREFRDTAHYIIDGDSLLLSTIHHINLNLNSYHGHTLHVIFIIERFLLALFQQSQQSQRVNYTLVFFDCHAHLYQQDSALLRLLRACLITHLSKNLGNIQQFPSWLDEKYLRFLREEKPMFLLYHNMFSLNFQNQPFLSQETFERLLCVYHLFGNYHQYTAHCQLYLMNKLTLNETTVKCFQMQFHRVCAEKLRNEIMSSVPSNTTSSDQERNWTDYETLCQSAADNDIRLFLYLQTLVQFIEESDPQTPIQLYSPLLILHVALLLRLSLTDRHLPSTFPAVTFGPKLAQFLARFQQYLAANVTSSVSSLSYAKIADLFDGRLFAFTLHQISQATIRWDSKTEDIVQQSLKKLNIRSNEPLFQEILQDLIESKEISFSTAAPETPTPSSKPKHQLMKITNPFLNAYLDPLLSSKDALSCELIAPDEDQILNHNRSKYIWNTYKDTGDEISRIHDNSAEKLKNDNPRYRTKHQQKLYDYFTLYGRSLATHDARDNQLQIVLPTASTPAPINKENLGERADSAATASGGKKKQQHKNQPKKVQVTKKEQIIVQNKQRILDKRTDDESEKLKNVESRLKQIPAEDYSEAIDLLAESLVNFKTTEKRLELLKRKFEIQRKYLRALKKKSQLSSEERSKFDLLQVGFFATMCEITHLENTADAFEEKKKYMEELAESSAAEREKWYRFQMEKINSRLPRREQGVPDDRADFIPDEWQVRFLNAVDARQSIIIVAPTASGKTYASYYAMGKVLKDKDDTNGICIYVAPTKALINQVAGTIHTKFGPVFGIFTTDYRMALDTCRILVTVPECLEMLLLSSTYQRWCQRIRYCIFDEIHCMSGDIGSDMWERAMLLINCPMIGLSATVNNGQKLEEWITKIEKQRSKLFQTASAREVRLISHHERLADLNKYLYSNRQLHPLHPISLMNAKQLTTRGMPDDFSLSPCETIRLNDAMHQVQGSAPPIPTLSEHFAPGWIAERSVCNSYSQMVCHQLKDLIQEKQSTTIDSISSALSPPGQVSYPELRPMSALVGEFVMTLKEKNLLPCIIFTDSRPLCEELAESVAQYLEEVENELRRTKYRRQIEELEKRLSLVEKAQKSAKAKKTVKTATKRNNDEDKTNENPAEMQQMEEEDQSYLRLSGPEQELLNGVLEEGTLSNRRFSDRELVDRLIERASTANKKLVRYLKRGVAYHHAELNNRGRLAVEGLFRNRHVQIVFSTWTLALGVHMPTKTVAFIKDSIELDALQYRQSSGRAGRRGFDVQGNVIFIDIPLSKIRHLTISAIPNIQTHLPTSVTFLMRLLYFYSQAEDKKDAINRSLVALQNPFNAHASDTVDLINLQLRYHCLYTLDFLYRLNFLDGQGNLTGLAGFITHLQHDEPANILFAYLLDTQSFQNISDEEQVVSLLAHLFTNMPWLMTHQSLPTRNSMFNPKLSLPPISSEIHRRIDRYNSLVKQIYGSYIDNLIQKIRSINSDSEQLPFSKIPFGQSSDYDAGSYEYHLHHHHSQQSRNPSISPFAGPSGLTHEQFMSNYQPSVNSWDLAANLDLSSRMIPFVDIDVRDHSGATYYLNSYALDFFKQGSERLLVTENGLEWGETYHHLQGFRHSLASIKQSLEKILENEVKTQTDAVKFFRPLAKLFSSVENEFWDKFRKHFK